MPKVTLDMNSFKALASDTRLNILKTLDGKKMSLKDISKATGLNKATLHEHLTKLTEAGIVKRKEREGQRPRQTNPAPAMALRPENSILGWIYV